MDSGLDARTDISAIKIFVPEAYHRVVDRAIQVWGAAGVSGDLPLAAMYQGARTLRLADGPDEVHKILIAKNVLKRWHGGRAGTSGTRAPPPRLPGSAPDPRAAWESSQDRLKTGRRFSRNARIPSA
jgi:hypothetical protein